MWDRRQLLTGAGVLALGGVLAGCAQETTPPEVPTGPELDGPTPANTSDQMEKVVEEIHTALRAADKAKDAKKLSPRVVGSAASFRSSTYEIIEKDKDWADTLVRPGTKTLVPITSTGSDFPRTALAVVEAEDADAAPYFMILRQTNAQSPYTTWGWAQRATDPGVELPMVAQPEVGAEPVGPDTDDLVMTPKAAMELYAKVLWGGNGKDPDDLLEDNPFQTETHKQIQDERKKLNEGVEKDEVGTIKEKYKVVEDEIAGLRTDDGGAVVLGVLTSTRTLRIKEGATVTFSEEDVFTRIIGRTTFQQEYVRTYGTVVALYIPSKDDGGKVLPIAASRSVLGASGQ